MANTIIARTREEVDKALRSSSERVVVEGDEDLLQYAQSKVEGAPRHAAPRRAATAPQKLTSSWALAPMALLALGGISLISLQDSAGPSGRPRAADRSVDLSQLTPFIWALIALVAIVLMYRLARLAIEGGSNVSLEWQVTEKIQGKLTVTRSGRSKPRN